MDVAMMDFLDILEEIFENLIIKNFIEETISVFYLKDKHY